MDRCDFHSLFENRDPWSNQGECAITVKCRGWDPHPHCRPYFSGFQCTTDKVLSALKARTWRNQQPLSG